MLSEVRTIIREVAAELGLSHDLLLSRYRRTDLVAARRVLMQRLFDSGRTMSQIARLLGFHHTTVMHALSHPPPKPRWRRPHIREIKGKQLELYDAWPVPDLSLVVFPTGRRVRRDGADDRAGKALRRKHGARGGQHRDHPPG